MALTQVPIELSSTPGIVDNSNATAITIDSSENVGIGVVPSIWSAAWTALDIGDGTLFSQNNRTTGLGSNIYFTGSNWLPKETGESALYQISQGTHNWYANSSVTSGVSFTPTTKMTLDASGNLLVGDTSATFNDTAKTVIRPSSDNWVIKPTVCTSFNRTASDGDILEFYKGSSNKVGSIGTLLSNLTVGTGDTGVQFNQDVNSLIPHNTTTGANVDNSISLGYSDGGSTNLRFKDLYLSGGAYLGGTAAANHLDDYEEGVHTTTLTAVSSGTITLNASYNKLYYTKIGRIVHVNGYLVVSTVSNAAGVLKISLPFTGKAVANNAASVFAFFNGLSSGTTGEIMGIIDQNSSTADFYFGSGAVVSATVAQTLAGNSDIRFTATYHVD